MQCKVIYAVCIGHCVNFNLDIHLQNNSNKTLLDITEYDLPPIRLLLTPYFVE